MRYKPDAFEHATADRIINRGRCLLTSVLVSPDGADGEVDIHDGISSADPIVCKIKAKNGITLQYSPSRPFLCQRGIFIVVNASTTHATVTFNTAEPYGLEGD